MANSDSQRIDSVVVIGCGTVGVPLAVAFASRGLDVLGVDIDAARVAALSAGAIDDPESGLADALREAIAHGRLRFARTCTKGTKRRAFILAVPTPVDDRGAAVMASLQAACETAIACAKDDDLLAIRSTVPVGTTRRIARDIATAARTMAVASCPERAISGRSFGEQFSVPHVVGGMDAAATRAARDLFLRLGEVVEVSAPEIAEAVKLFCNVQRDVTFALANHFALTSEALGLDIAEIERAATAGYPRFHLSRPGPVGGPCLPKDALLLEYSVSRDIVRPAFTLTARAVNASLLDHVVAAIADHLRQAGRTDPVIAVLGIAFKGDPPTSDRRGSFGVALAEQLAAAWRRSAIKTWDPVTDRDIGVESVVHGADVAIFANDHPAIKTLDIDALARAMRPGGMIYDVCGGLDRARVEPPNGVQLYIFGRGHPLGGTTS